MIFPDDYDLHAVATPLTRTPVRGQSCHYSLFFIPLNEKHSIAKAYRDAIIQVAGADALIDAEVEESQNVTIAINEYCYRVQGMPARLLR
ncbi:MAG: hypothetical protein ACXWP5_12630 [Bdellovibrionota bacterium]